MELSDLYAKTAKELRTLFRANQWTRSTGGLATSNLQTNLVVVHKDIALDFARFCLLNPQPCPLIAITAPGSGALDLAVDANLYTDLPRYRVIENGAIISEPLNVEAYRTDDSVAFLLGCSVTFEQALLAAEVPVRHLAAETNAPMYITNLACKPAGLFRGPVVVTMRAIPRKLVETAVQVTAAMPDAHGSPMHIGDPAQIGVSLDAPDYGDPPILHTGDVPVFWGCGVTPQEVAINSRLNMITHYPGAMFITDRDVYS